MFGLFKKKTAISTEVEAESTKDFSKATEQEKAEALVDADQENSRGLIDVPDAVFKKITGIAPDDARDHYAFMGWGRGYVSLSKLVVKNVAGRPLEAEDSMVPVHNFEENIDAKEEKINEPIKRQGAVITVPQTVRMDEDQALDLIKKSKPYQQHLLKVSFKDYEDIMQSSPLEAYDFKECQNVLKEDKMVVFWNERLKKTANIVEEKEAPKEDKIKPLGKEALRKLKRAERGESSNGQSTRGF